MSEIRISRNYFPKGNPWTESFYSGQGGTLGRGRGKQPVVIALMSLMAGRLDEGLRCEIKGGGNQGVE
jgi:hypothetical protein